MRSTQCKYEVFVIGSQRFEDIKKKETSYIYVLVAIQFDTVNYFENKLSSMLKPVNNE